MSSYKFTINTLGSSQVGVAETAQQTLAFIAAFVDDVLVDVKITDRHGQQISIRALKEEAMVESVLDDAVTAA